MSKRKILFNFLIREDELRLWKRIAKKQDVSLSELIRSSVRSQNRFKPPG